MKFESLSSGCIVAVVPLVIGANNEPRKDYYYSALDNLPLIMTFGVIVCVGVGGGAVVVFV